LSAEDELSHVILVAQKNVPFALVLSWRHALYFPCETFFSTEYDLMKQRNRISGLNTCRHKLMMHSCYIHTCSW